MVAFMVPFGRSMGRAVDVSALLREERSGGCLQERPHVKQLSHQTASPIQTAERDLLMVFLMWHKSHPKDCHCFSGTNAKVCAVSSHRLQDCAF